MGRTGFKIYSLLAVKNEADVITASLLDASRWSDKIIVIDNGSTDGTWEIVQQLSTTHPQIVPFMQYKGAFHIGLRARAFKAFRHEMKRGDWWCVRLDADEFYPGDVRTFLASVPWYYNNIKKISTDYILTIEDIAHIPFDKGFEAVRPLMHHSLPHHRKERRFVRHSPCLIWKDTWRYPHLLGRTSSKYIPVEHYQYRSPQQMEKRFLTRQQAKVDGCGSFKHEQGNSWKDYLLSDRQLEEARLLHNLEEAFGQSDHILHEGRNTVKVIGEDLVVKYFRPPCFPNSLIYGTLRKSKARRSYEYAIRLGDMSPEPVAYSEKRRWGLLRGSYYVSRLSPLPYTFRMLSRDKAFPERVQRLTDIARFTARLHNQGILHKDYSGGNILFDDEGHIQIVDLNRMKFHCKIGLRKGCFNFSRLPITADECRLVAKVYAEERGMSVAQCTRYILASHNHL